MKFVSGAALALCGLAQAAPPKPHVLFILVDDLGHAELGYNRQQKTDEVQTPHIDDLVSEGVRLDRHYVHKFCSPTRCAIQSGRAPIHVNVINAPPEVHNPADPVGGYQGIARNMTGIAAVMRGAGYKTHFAGKWDAGMATPDHTPAGRGYDSSLSYFHHSNDYWTLEGVGDCPKNSSSSSSIGGGEGRMMAPEGDEELAADIVAAGGGGGGGVGGGSVTMKDLWNYKSNHNPVIPYPGRPARHFVNDARCTVASQAGNYTCVWEDDLFEQRVTETIKAHDVDTPLFLFWATHTVHGPLQPKDADLARFEKVITDSAGRAKYHSMVGAIDSAIGRVVALLKQRGMYNDTLIAFASDNGGPLPSANNFPLKGGKFSNWEGGIRVAAFASGGLLPPAVRGTASAGLMAGWDWYRTFASLAGADATDHRAAAAGLPPVDSLDMWPMLSGANATSPRAQLEIGSNTGGEHGRTSGNTTVGGVLVPPYKIVLGDGPPGTPGMDNGTIDMATWTGPQSPNNSQVPAPATFTQTCGRTPETGCLYDVYADPNEHVNLAQAKPDVFAALLAKVDELQAGVYSPYRGSNKNEDACAFCLASYDGFWGPFIDTH